MTSREWRELLAEMLKDTEDTLVSKGEVYSMDFDRLGNFKTAGRVLDVEPPTALVGIMSKHLVKCLDIVTMYQDGGRIPSREQCRETFGDLRNYLYLLEALFADIRQEKATQTGTSSQTPEA